MLLPGRGLVHVGTLRRALHAAVPNLVPFRLSDGRGRTAFVSGVMTAFRALRGG